MESNKIKERKGEKRNREKKKRRRMSEYYHWITAGQLHSAFPSLLSKTIYR